MFSLTSDAGSVLGRMVEQTKIMLPAATPLTDVYTSAANI